MSRATSIRRLERSLDLYVPSTTSSGELRSFFIDYVSGLISPTSLERRLASIEYVMRVGWYDTVTGLVYPDVVITNFVEVIQF